MKQRNVYFLLSGLALSFFVIALACNKLTQTEPSSLTEIEESFSSQRQNVVFTSLTGNCSAPDKGEMEIKFHGNNDEKVSIRSILGVNIPASQYTIKLFNGLTFNQSTGKVIIPNDGFTYWFVSIDTSEIPLRIKGGAYNVTCACPGGSCEPATNPETEEIFCFIGPNCTGCCVMTLLEEPSNIIATPGGAILRAQEIEINGKVFKASEKQYFFGSATGPCTNPSNFTMHIHVKDDQTVIKTKPKGNTTDQPFKFITLEIPSSNGIAHIPLDGNFWFIPFDTTDVPTRITGGAIVELICTCDNGSGDCKRRLL